MDSRLKALASQDAAWTEIAEKEEQLQGMLKSGFQNESDIALVQETITLVLAEIAWRKAELLKLQSDNECELVVGGTYQIAFMDTKQDPGTWYNGPATFVGLDPEDYETGERNGHFQIRPPSGLNYKNDEEVEVVSFPLSSVGRRVK